MKEQQTNKEGIFAKTIEATRALMGVVGQVLSSVPPALIVGFAAIAPGTLLVNAITDIGFENSVKVAAISTLMIGGLVHFLGRRTTSRIDGIDE